MTAPVLVSGATANVGGARVHRLAESGETVRALVRREVELPPGVEPVRGDLTDPDSLGDALAGVDRVFLLWPTGDPAGVAEAATRLAGRRVVYLSAYGVEGEPDPISRMHAAAEAAVREQADEWTILRAGEFAGNTLGWADQVRAGTVRWPYAGAARSLVHEADPASLAHHALTTDDLVGAAPHLTDPEVLTQAEHVGVIGEVLGRTVRFEELPRAEAREQMLGWDGPPRWSRARWTPRARWSTTRRRSRPRSSEGWGVRR